MSRTKPPGSGRQAGTPNKTTKEMRELAQQYGPDCLAFWASLLHDPNADMAYRLVAARELADRGYGKPSRTIELQARSGVDYDRMSNAELAERARQVLAALAAGPQRQLPERTIADGDEIVDGGVVVPDPAPEPVGLNPAGERAQGSDKP